VRDVHKIVDEDVSLWEYPTVKCVVSWYGILDLDSWKDRGPLAWGLEWTVDAHRARNPGLFLSASAFASRRCDFLAIAEACERGWVETYPSLLLIAGSTDPLGLVHSSRRARIILKTTVKHLGEIEYGEYEAGHAFIGLNPFILAVLHGAKWRTELALPATKRTIDFLVRHHGPGAED
jgi:hypothetical protein